MQLALNLIGVLIGIVLALMIHKIGAFLRCLSAILPATVVGWCVSVFALISIGSMTMAWWQFRKDPYMPMAGAWGLIALSLLLTICLCTLLGIVHSRRYELPWAQTFGVVMLQVGLVAGCIWLLQANLYTFADALRGGNNDTGRILGSFQQIRETLGYSHLMMSITFLVLEFAPPFSLRRSPSV